MYEKGDPLLNDDHALAFELATQDELTEIHDITGRVNSLMSEFFDSLGITLVDFKLEYGKDAQGRLLLADEISPDTCRFWDKETGKKLDKDRFRRDLGDVEDAYAEMLSRVSSAGSRRSPEMILDDDKLHEECGVFGMWAPKNVHDAADELYRGLLALQHRGQESAGITVCIDGALSTEKGLGLISSSLQRRRYRRYERSHGHRSCPILHGRFQQYRERSASGGPRQAGGYGRSLTTAPS
jgi:hypothetical protein